MTLDILTMSSPEKMRKASLAYAVSHYPAVTLATFVAAVRL